MGQGYPDQGLDKRLLPGLGWLQKLLIIKQPEPQDVEQIQNNKFRLTFQACPPFIMIEFKCKHWHQIRAGWTWRIYQRYYIPGLAIKKEDNLEPDYNNIKDIQ